MASDQSIYRRMQEQYITALKSPAGFAEDYSEEYSFFPFYYCITCFDRLNLHAYKQEVGGKIYTPRDQTSLGNVFFSYIYRGVAGTKKCGGANT